LTLYLKGECKKNPTKNNHFFLHDTGDKKSVAKVNEAFFLASYLYIFMFFLKIFSLKSLSCIFNNFLGPPRARFNHYKGLIALPYGLSHTAKKPKMRLLTVLKESTV
jgi:hypothetical protein